MIAEGDVQIKEKAGGFVCCCVCSRNNSRMHACTCVCVCVLEHPPDKLIDAVWLYALYYVVCVSCVAY